MKFAKCHPLVRLYAKGLCSKCYHTQWQKLNYPAKPLAPPDCQTLWYRVLGMMQSRVRCGEPIESVLADYGLTYSPLKCKFLPLKNGSHTSE